MSEVKNDNPFRYVSFDMDSKRVKTWNKVEDYNIEDVKKISEKISSNEDVANFLQALMHYCLDVNEIDDLNSNEIYLIAIAEKVESSFGCSELQWFVERFKKSKGKDHIGSLCFDKFDVLTDTRKLEVIEQLKLDLRNFVIEKENDYKVLNILVEKDFLDNENVFSLLEVLKYGAKKYGAVPGYMYGTKKYVAVAGYDKNTETWVNGKWFNNKEEAESFIKYKR